MSLVRCFYHVSYFIRLPTIPSSSIVTIVIEGMSIEYLPIDVPSPDHAAIVHFIAKREVVEN